MADGKSTSLAFSSYMNLNEIQHEERIRYRDQINQVVQNLDALNKSFEDSSRKIKDVIKPLARKYTETASINIPKVRIDYNEIIFINRQKLRTLKNMTLWKKIQQMRKKISD